MRKKINNVSNWLKKASALFLVLSVALILVTPVYSATGGAVAASSDWQVTVQNKLETAKIGVFKFSKFVGVSLAEYGRNTVKMVEFFGASLGGQMNNLGLDLKNGAKKISTGSETLGKQMGDYVGAVVGLGATAASRLNSAANQITELPRQTVQSIGAAGSFVGRGFQATSSKLQSINIGRELQVISSKLQDLAGRVSDLAIDLGRGLQEQSVEISAKLASLAKSEEPVAEVAPVSAPAPGGDIGKTIIVGPKPAEPAPITNPKTVAKKLTETNAAPSVKTIIEKQVSTVVRTNDLSRAEAEKIISELIVKNRIITADKDGVATLTGLRVASLVDFTGADIKGLPQTAAAPAANPTAPPPLPNVYNTFISSSPVSIQPVVGTIGGVTTDFSVGRNLTVSQDATVASTLTIATVANPAGNLVVNGAASVSGATTLAAATLSGLLTANSGATIGDTSADTLTINAITSSTAPISIIASSSGAMLYVKNTASVSSTDPHPALRIAGSVADKNLDLFVDENGNAKIRTTAGGGGNIYMHPDGGSVYLQTNLIVGSSGNATIQASGRANFSYDPVVGAPSLWLSTSSTYPTYKTYIAIDPAETVSFDRFLHFSHGNNDRLILGYDGDLLLNASSTYSGNLFTIRKEGSSRFYVDNSGNVNASGTLSAAAMSIAGNLNPASDNLYDIGSSSTQWRYGNFQGGLLVADGTTTSTLSNNSLILGQTSGSNVGKFYVDTSGNTSVSGTLTVFGSYTAPARLTIDTNGLFSTASSTLLATSTLDYQSFSLGNNSFTSSANGTTTISSLETSNLNFPDDAGAVGWVNLQITTTTANIENSFTASINDYPALMIYGLSNTAGTAGNIGVMFASSTAPWADFDVNNRFTIASSTGNTNTSGTLRVWGGASTGGLLVSSSNTTTTLTSYVSGNGVGAFVLDTNTLFAPASSTVLLSVRNGGNKVFSVSNDGYVASTGTFNANVASSGIGDVAEYVNLIPNESVEPGDVLVVSKDTPNKYKKSTTAYTKEIAGVVSDTGAFIIGASGEGRAPLALAGLVRVKVTIENGPIGVGDYLVSASQPGKAMKYDTANPQAAGLVGMALEPATADGRITIMVNKGLLDGAAVTNLNVTENVNGQLVQNNDLNLGGFSIYNVKAITGANGLWSIDEEGKMVAINIKVDKAQAKQLVIEKDNAANKSTVGEAKILAGQTSALVANEMVSSSGKIFITFRNNPKAFWWISRQEDGLFEVSLSQSASEDVVFDYWLVGVVSPVILPPTGGTPTSDVGATTESLPPPVAPSVVEPPPAEVPPVVEPPATEPPLTSSDVTPTDSVGATENVIPTQVEESSPATPTP